MTLNAKKIPDDLRFVGIRDRDLEFRPKAGENIFPFEVVDVVEEPCDFLVTLRISDAAPLLWQVDKNLWRGAVGDNVSVRLPADKILLLRG